MNTRITGIGEVRTLFNQLGLLPKSAVRFKRLAQKGRKIVLKRTAKGVDVSGSAFQPYSQSYQDYKNTRAGFQVTRVNLHDRGLLLGAMTTSGNQKGARVFFADELNNSKAVGHDEGKGKLPKRQFFALSDSEVNSEIVPLVRADIDNAFSRL